MFWDPKTRVLGVSTHYLTPPQKGHFGTFGTFGDLVSWGVYKDIRILSRPTPESGKVLKHPKCTIYGFWAISGVLGVLGVLGVPFLDTSFGDMPNYH